MRLRQLGLGLLAPLLLAAGTPGHSLYLNGQPLAGSPVHDRWIPLAQLWPLGIGPATASDAGAWTSPAGEQLPLRWRLGEPAVDIDDLAKVGVKVTRREPIWQLTKPLAELRQFKVDADAQASRLVWDTDRFCAWRWHEEDRRLVVELGGAAGTWPATVGGAGVVKGVTVATPSAGVVRLEIDRRYPTPVTLATDGRHFELSLANQFALDDETPLPGGVSYRHHYEADERGPLSWHVLRIPHDSPYRVQVLLGDKNGRFGRAPVSKLAAAAGATAAINAGYFSFKDDLPLGLLMQGGNVLTSPLYNRSLLALPKSGAPFVTRTQVSLEVLAADGQSAEIDWVNYPRQRNSLAAYTDRYGASTRTAVDGVTWEVAVSAEGRIEAEGDHDLPIPPGGVVLAGQGPVASWLKRTLHVGDLASVRSKLSQLWPDVEHAIAGGPTLVDGGQVVVTADEEKFAADITQGRAPRTAVGILPAGDLLWLVVDGRDPGHSRGLTLQETGRLLSQLGSIQGLNLDGGGSSTLVINGRVVNRPSDGKERAVSTGIGLVPATATVLRSSQR